MNSNHLFLERESGLEVELVDITAIGNNQSSIYNYVRSYYNQSTDFLYLLLVGDHNKVASYNAVQLGDGCLKQNGQMPSMIGF